MFPRGNEGLLSPSKDSFPSIKFRVTRPNLDCHSPSPFILSERHYTCTTHNSSQAVRPYLHSRRFGKYSTSNTQFLSDLMNFVGRDSVVDIEIRYALEGLGIESRWGEIFLTSPAREPTQPPIQWVLGYSRKKNGRDVALINHPI